MLHIYKIFSNTSVSIRYSNARVRICDTWHVDEKLTVDRLTLWQISQSRLQRAFGKMTRVNLRKKLRRFCKVRHDVASVYSHARSCAGSARDAYPREMESVGSRERTYWYIFCRPTRAFANDIPFEMESPPECSPRRGLGQVDAHVCTYVYTRSTS